MRLSGLASGFDTDTMVQNLMRVERMKVDRFTQRRQVNIWRQESYNAMNKNIANFILNSKKNMGLNKSSSTGTVMNQSYKNLDYVKKASSYDESVAEVNVVGKSANGKFEIEVEELAKDAKYTTGSGYKMDTEINDEIKINGVVVGKKGDKLKDVLNNISANDKLKKQGVTAFLDENTGRVFIQGRDDGKKGEKSNSYKLEVLGFDLNVKEAVEEAGSYGKAKINGVEFNELTSNELKFNGLNIDMKKVGKTTIEVSTNTEEIIDRIQGLVKEYNELVEQISGAVSEKRYPSYHPLSQEEKSDMSDRDVELWEEKAKSGMLNRDETLNRMMQNVRGELFKNVEGLDGPFNNITQIGITTEKYSKGAAGGKLQIDEFKLRAAIEKDADGVMELLFAEEKKDLELKDDSAVGSTNRGVFTGVYENMISGMKDIVHKSGPGEDSDLLRNVKSNLLIDFVTSGSMSDIDKDVRSIDKRISDLEAMLVRRENSYYERFTAMEKYMYKMNSQADWLGQQMMMM